MKLTAQVLENLFNEWFTLTDSSAVFFESCSVEIIPSASMPKYLGLYVPAQPEKGILNAVVAIRDDLTPEQGLFAYMHEMGHHMHWTKHRDWSEQIDSESKEEFADLFVLIISRGNLQALYRPMRANTKLLAFVRDTMIRTFELNIPDNA